MIDKPEPTEKVKRDHIIEALCILGYKELEKMDGFFMLDEGNREIVVDLTEGKKAVFFKTNNIKSIVDDEEGTLAKIGKVITDAENSIMPEIPPKPKNQDAGDVPRPVASIGDKKEPVEKEKQDAPDEQEPPEQENQDAITQPGEDIAPAEIIHNTAAPLQESFQPQGMMIMNIQPGLAEIGAIKIGGTGEEKKSKKTGKPYRLPVKYDHFVIRTKQKGPDGDYLVDPIMKEWGYSGTFEDGPVELDIYLLYNDPTANFLTSYRQYKGGKCLCSGNGMEATTADGKKIACNTETCPKFISKLCKPNGILSVILKDAPTLGGVYKFRTTSYNSIRQLLSSMFFIKSATGGYLANIPLKMTLTPKTVNPIDSPTAQTAYIVNLVYPGNVEDLHNATIELVKERASMRQEIMAIEAQARTAICAPETKESILEIEEEFYPDQGE